MTTNIPNLVQTTEILVDRFVSDKDTTISQITIGSDAMCYGLEDEFRTNKVYGKTRIPAGTYAVGLRKEGEFHKRYSERFPEFHRGMLHIKDVPDFSNILIHCGNNHKHTAGCLIVGAQAVFEPGNLHLKQSEYAYIRFYQSVVRYAEKEVLLIRFVDNDRRSE